MKLIKPVLLALGILVPTLVTSQTTITVGSEDLPNFFVDLDGPYSSAERSHKSQLLFTQQELVAAGLELGDIVSMGLNVVQPSGNVLSDFTISIGVPDSDFNGNFQTGLTTVFGPEDYTATNGWNANEFSTPYFWDGISDILVETCYDNQGPGNQANFIWLSFAEQESYKESDHNGPNYACDDVNPETINFERPQTQFTFFGQAPPIADFGASTFAPCSGFIELIDLSTYSPDTWLWYFGDGTTSEEQNPSHTYSEDGTYDIALVVTNEFGSDSILIEEAFTVTLASAPPLAASCIPSTSDQTIGFGPINVSLAGMSVPSLNGSVGYEDLTCSIFELDQGVEYEIEVEADGPADSHVVAWIDFNSDGIFTEEEKIMSQVTDHIAIASFTIPLDALTDSTLRMRVISDFYLIGEQAPCAEMQGGQGDDYGVNITANVEPPQADLSFSPSFSCSGSVQFYDESINVPTAWLWQFGDGELSFDQDPLHTYVESGTYTVSLSVQNDFGTDEIIFTDAVTVDLDQNLVNSCSVPTQDYCCGYGLIDFSLEGISNSSENGSAGYEDFTCLYEAELTGGMSYTFSANTGTENPQDVHVFIDLNNDGDFTANERIVSSLNSTIHNETFIMPSPIQVIETRVRMRVIADFVGNNNDGCSAPLFGQAEDYAVVLYPDTSPPVVDFSTNETFSCDGEITFTNLSTNSNDFTWYFGDGLTSDASNPTHTFTSSGTYTISLVGTNDFGMDSLAIEDYITVDYDIICDTILLPSSGNDPDLTDCSGFLSDDGGPDFDYSNDSDGAVSIVTEPGNYIRLEFVEFFFQFNNDFLRIYDGPNQASPLIGEYTGINLPGGGIVESTGNAITVHQITNFFGTNSGFLLIWSCLPVGVDEILNQDAVQIGPNPTEDHLNIFLSDDIQLESISITDNQGRMVLINESVENGRLDVSELTSGCYYLHIRTQQGQMNKRLIIR